MKTVEIHGASPICPAKTYVFGKDGQIVFLDNRLGLTPGDTLAILTPDEVAAMTVPDAVIDAAMWVLRSDNVTHEEIDWMATFIVNLWNAQQKGGA